MNDNTLLTIELGILILLLVASVAAIAFKRLKFPYTVGLVIVGIVLGWLAETVEILAPLQGLALSHDLILFLFVPPLIFDSAQGIDFRLLSRNLTPIAMLAVPGLLLSTVIIGLMMSQLTPLTLGPALLFGAIVSATDPVAVIALFKEFGVPNRLMTLVEGESLFNDAMAIVTVDVLLVAIASGAFSLAAIGSGLEETVVKFVGGILVGSILAVAMGYFTILAKNNVWVQTTVSFVVAYATFIIAEEALHVAGVIAVLTAGLIVGWLNANRQTPEVISNPPNCT